MMQDYDWAKKCYANTDSISKVENKGKAMVIVKEPHTINYFLPDPNQYDGKRVSAEITQQLQGDFYDILLA